MPEGLTHINTQMLRIYIETPQQIDWRTTMKTIIKLLVLMGLIFGSFCPARENIMLKPHPVFTIYRGTNISHWLSQSERRGEERRAWFTKSDVAYLARLGFDHLRIPVDEEQLWDAGGNMEKEAFDLLNAALDWCAEYRLKAIVDLHILRSHHFNKKEKPLWTDPKAQERFLRCWSDLSSQLIKRPVDAVAYELMNEAVAEDPEQWNQLIAKAMTVLRLLEPDRVIVIGSNRWQIPDTFDELRVPANDKNILLSFHFYTPMVFTHYKASWTPVGQYTGPVRYPGRIITDKDLKGLPEDLLREITIFNSDFNQAKLDSLIQEPIRVAKKLGLSLYCGEWGCLPTVPEKDRLKWYADIRSNLEKHGIAWATWDYKGNFGLLDQEGKPAERLIRVLLK
jgi:endoglucanase